MHHLDVLRDGLEFHAHLVLFDALVDEGVVVVLLGLVLEPLAIRCHLLEVFHERGRLRDVLSDRVLLPQMCLQRRESLDHRLYFHVYVGHVLQREHLLERHVTGLE